MEDYGRQRVQPTTPSRIQRQRFPSQDALPYPDYYGNRQQQASVRYSLPAPGSRPSPKSLPPQHTSRRQSSATAYQTPHFATPTRSRYHGTGHPQSAGSVQANAEQWESLRSRGYVLKGSKEAQRSSVTFAPLLQTPSVTSRSHASSSSTLPKHPSQPAFQVHPSLRTGYHPGAAPAHSRPQNQFMRTPMQTRQPHRKPLVASPPYMPPSRNDVIDAALVLNPAPPVQQAITFHASSFTPDPIYRSQYIVRSLPAARNFSDSSAAVPPNRCVGPTRRNGTAGVTANPPLIPTTSTSPTFPIFSRPTSPEPMLSKPHPDKGCQRSSTLKRQETDQSTYSQATLPEPYIPSLRKPSVDQQPSPFILADWEPLSVDPVRTKSKDARALWLDLERALMGSPPVGSSEATTPSLEALLDLEKNSRGQAKAGDCETTYDFRAIDEGQNDSVEATSFQSGMTRPPLVRTDGSADRLEHHRALASSIVEKAHVAAAKFREVEVDPKEHLLPNESNHVQSPTGKHVRIASREEVIETSKVVKPASARPSKIPRLATGARQRSRLPVLAGRRAPVKQVAFGEEVAIDSGS